MPVSQELRRRWWPVFARRRPFPTFALAGVLGGIGLGGCAYPQMKIEPRYVDVEPQQDCQRLRQRADSDGWRAYVDDRWTGFGGVAPSDETWVVRADTRLVFGRYTLPLRRLRAESIAVNLRCARSQLVSESVPTRTCHEGTRQFAVVDPVHVERIVSSCQPDERLWIEVVAEFHDGSVARSYDTVTIRHSLRPWIEVVR